MTSEDIGAWRQTTAGELARAGVLVMNDGYRAKNAELGETGVPFARAGNVKNGIDLASADCLRGDRLSRVGNKLSEPGDVVFTSKGTVGRFAFVRPSAPRFVYSPQLCFWRVADRDAVDPRFLYFWMQGAECIRQFGALKGQTDMADYISLRDQHGIRLTLPRIDEQRRIASVLSALDDKIDSNRRLAKLLEETASTLFRARFVDFVGVADFVESEIGPIPRGWRVDGVYAVATVTYGAPFKSALFTETDGTPLIRIRDLGKDEPGVCTPEQRPRARLIRPGDIVVGMDGEFRVHLWHGPASWLNQRVCAFDPLPGASRAFVFEAIKGPLAFYEATKGGTTVIHLGKRDIDAFRLDD